MTRLPNQILDALADYELAAAKCADARVHEMLLEDSRAEVKFGAISRLMQTANALTGKPHSASSAADVVTSDPEYEAHLGRQRAATHAHLMAQCEKDSARLKALALANMAAELVAA